jgi:hypothetical protein
VVLPLRLAAVCLVLTGTARADTATNIVWPVVSVQMISNTAASGAPAGVFTVQRTGDTGQVLVVNYRLGGTATNGMDYQRLSGTVTIPAGETSARIEVAPVDHQQPGDAKNVALTLVTRNQPFALVALPDTQCYTHELLGATRDIFTTQTQWIVDHRDELNIAFVLHEGDLTDQNTAADWTNARTSMSLLNGVVPYALALGNHDGLWTASNSTALFNQFFPVSQFQGLPTFGGVFESNRMDNCYHLFSAGGLDWIAFALEFGPRNSVLAWANQIASNYPTRQVVMVTHAHVYLDNTLHGTYSNQAWLPTGYGRDNNGTNVWDKFLRRHANARAAFNGHILANGTGRIVTTGDNGNPVYQMLANYQMNVLGGAGYLRLVRFFPDQRKMSVTTYSPYLDSWLTNADNQFAYTNLNFFTNASPGYLVDTQYASASLWITNNATDTVPPGISALSCMGLPPVIKVTFNEPVEPASAQTAANYAINQGVHLTGASLQADGKTVALTTDSVLVTNRLYALTVSHVKDTSPANNEITTPATNTFTYYPVFLSDDFADGQLPGWTVVDETTNNAPSRWLERSGRLMQLSDIGGPNLNATNHRQGTYIYWNDAPALNWSNYSFSVTFNSIDDDGVGVLFRYQNPSNYYKVDLDSQRNFRKLFRVADGVETTLASESGGYVVASNYVLRVELTNNEINVLLNGLALFGGTITNSGLPGGTVGLYSWGSQGAFFSNLKVTLLHRSPRLTICSPTNNDTFYQPGPVTVAVDATDPDGVVKKVNLYWNSSLLATLTNAPYAYSWANLYPGRYSLTAQAIDDDGLTQTVGPLVFWVTPPPPKPQFTVQPVNQSVRAGSGAMFNARADGPPPICYQWSHNGVPINGATNTYLILNNVQTANAGTHTVQVSNQWGSVLSDPAMLTVTSPILPVGDTNAPPGVHMVGVMVMDPGVAVISVNLTNATVVRIDWSSNFSAWLPLLTLTNCGDTAYFSDPDAASQPQRFYRAVAQP